MDIRSARFMSVNDHLVDQTHNRTVVLVYDKVCNLFALLLLLGC